MKTEGDKLKVCEEEDSLFFPKGVRSKTNKRYERWNFEENQDYVDFLRRNESMFNDPIGRRSTAIYNKMAIQLNNGRNNHQCRSHHMKMLKKYSSLQGIINQILEDPRLDKKSKDLIEGRRNTDIPGSEQESVAKGTGEMEGEMKRAVKTGEYMEKKSEGDDQKNDGGKEKKREANFQPLKIENILILGPSLPQNKKREVHEQQSLPLFSLNRSSSAFKLVQTNNPEPFTKTVSRD